MARVRPQSGNTVVENLLSIRFVPVAIVINVLLSLSSAGAQERPGTKFRDCDSCPEMVIIPSGSFTMGGVSAEGHDAPRHSVVFSRPFAVSTFMVTVADWRRFVDSHELFEINACSTRRENGSLRNTAGANWRTPGFAQTETHPVVCVSWVEIVRYLRWLSEESGKTYRLLSEAEWEYVARAGQSDAELARWVEEAHGNLGRSLSFDDSCCHPGVRGLDRWMHTSPSGAFPPNPFGVYDMLGNVESLVADCVNEDYVGAPDDGSPWLTRERTMTRWGANAWTIDGQCFGHIQRGANWASPPAPSSWFSARGWWYPYIGGDFYGFRVAVSVGQ